MQETDSVLPQVSEFNQAKRKPEKIDASDPDFKEVKCLIMHDDSSEHQTLVKFQRAFRAECNGSTDRECPFHNIMHLPSFNKTNLAYPNQLLSRVINKGEFKFIAYLGVMTKEIAIYCGLDKFTGQVIDYSFIDRIESLKGQVDEEGEEIPPH